LAIGFTLFNEYFFAMNRYLISYTNPHRHFIDIEFIADVKTAETNVQLPAWRPGRYELGNFAKNVQQWAAYDESGKPLQFKKITKDCWQVQTKGVKTLHVKYNYYAADLNAGSTFLDVTQLYMNPVNCCVYIEGRINEPCHIDLQIPPDYKVACGMKRAVEQKKGVTCFAATDFHELADSPFIASATMQHNMFVLDGVEFNLWFQGDCKLEWAKIIGDFFIFINEQFVMMKEFPTDAYHFLFQILPYRFHHGVEHVTSTVIAMGPGYNLMKPDMYDDFLGVSSHELFHCWNIKTIRPIEMMPYNYTRENYTRLGYVAEGVTTYYGDFLLYRSGDFNDAQFFDALSFNLQRHMDNFGRYNLSVADSSFDTWLDGYVPGIPNRKTSIYDEGCLLALMTDILIRQHSDNRNSLDDVMRYLYFQYAKQNKGYSETDYIKAVEQFAETPLTDFFQKYVYTAVSYDEKLKELITYLGLHITVQPAKKYYESHVGIKISETENHRITHVYPNSLADKAQLWVGDELIAVNGTKIKNDLDALLHHHKDADVLTLTVQNAFCIRDVIIKPAAAAFYKTYLFAKLPHATDEQKRNFELWAKRKF
jgi:predicted metalloprotease with PDZ domain